MMQPQRLIDMETLKTGASLLNDVRRSVNDLNAFATCQQRWMNWAAMYAGDIMKALTAYAALEEVLDHTWITELVWMGDPGRWWELHTDTDQTGEEEGCWMGATMDEVLCSAAADFAAADEMEK